MDRENENIALSLRGSTKQKILDIAEALLAKRGFNGFSYKHISTLLGIKNAAIHYHYPTKADLGIEIIARSRIRFQEWAEEIEKRELNPSQKMDALISLYKELLKSKHRFIFVTALESNFEILPEEMQQETRMLVLDYLSWLENVLKEGREDGSFSHRSTDSDMAHVIWAILNGAMYMIRILDESCLETVVGQIKAMIGR